MACGWASVHRLYGIECGYDRSGRGQCGVCPTDYTCRSGHCIYCAADCNGLECGEDRNGCGVTCGSCSDNRYSCQIGHCVCSEPDTYYCGRDGNVYYDGNCGRCRSFLLRVCESGICEEGQCVAASPIPCREGDRCPNSLVCRDGQCRPPLRADDEQCESSSNCRSGRCVESCWNGPCRRLECHAEGFGCSRPQTSILPA
jgi:hypothetical protein